jgi:FAD/FMN-containing dehydrogenase
MPPAPSHALWLCWHPKRKREDMAFSLEGKNYLAAYGEWKNPADDVKYANWATECIGSMYQHGKGIQLADENLGRRPAKFLSDENFTRLQKIRAKYNPDNRFNSWRATL